MVIHDEWQYYNHAWIPTVPPHKCPNLEPMKDGKLLKSEGGVLARYTTQFDCGFETEWWYIIKDDVFDINALKSKLRYVVKQGLKNFDIKIIDASKYKENIFKVAYEAFTAYPKKYRPILDKIKFFNEIDGWSKEETNVYAAFLKETNEIVGYAVTENNETCINLNILKTIPSFEKMQVNAALVCGILNDCEQKLSSGYYICNGARNVLHETRFPEYLIKYFAFRKAYCKLNLIYNPKYKLLVKFCYKLRKLFYKLDSIKKIHQLNGVLKMEEICRRQK